MDDVYLSMTMPDSSRDYAPLTVTLRRDVADGIAEFELRHASGGGLAPFTPGAHLRVRTPAGAERKYSLTNIPADNGRYVIAVKREAGGRGGSISMVDTLREGDTLHVGRPENAFALSADAKRFIFIAGGIGITPILCMVRTLVQQQQAAAPEPVPFTLFYLTRDEASTAFRTELSALGKSRALLHHDGGDPARAFDLWPVLEKPVPGTHVYCCGPRGLMDSVRDMSGHWSASSIHFESFGIGDAARYEPNQAFSIRLARTGGVIRVDAQQTALEALLAQGCRVSSSCEAGSCGSCRTRYIAGDVEHRDMVLLEEEKADQIMVCVSRARGGELVLDL